MDKEIITLSILYRNGAEDTIELELDEEEKKIVENKLILIENCIKSNKESVVSFGNGYNVGYNIRVSDITRIKVANYYN